MNPENEIEGLYYRMLEVTMCCLRITRSIDKTMKAESIDYDYSDFTEKQKQMWDRMSKEDSLLYKLSNMVNMTEFYMWHFQNAQKEIINHLNNNKK